MTLKRLLLATGLTSILAVGVFGLWLESKSGVSSQELSLAVLYLALGALAPLWTTLIRRIGFMRWAGRLASWCHSRWMSWRRRFWIGTGILTALLLTTWTAGEVWSRAVLREEMAKALDLGPLDFQQLLPPMPLADENGCPELIRASELMTARASRARGNAEASWFWEAGNSKAFSSSTPWSPKEIQIAGDALGSAEEILTLIRQGADRPHIRHTLDTNGMLLGLKLQHLKHLLRTGALLQAAARVEMENGNADQALSDLGRASRIGKSLEEEPILISHLVDMALKGKACDGVGDVLQKSPRTSQAVLSKLSEALRMDARAYHQALLGERCFGVDAIDRLTAGDSIPGDMDAAGMPEFRELSMLSLPLRPWLRWQKAVYLRMFTDLIPRAETPGRPLVLEQDIPRLALLPRLLIPVMDKARIATLKNRARCNATRWALAVLQHRMKTGKLPASLDEIATELIPDRPTDPWMPGKPFVYRPEADGSAFALYSLGENQADDGGDFVQKPVPNRGNVAPDLGVRWKVR